MRQMPSACKTDCKELEDALDEILCGGVVSTNPKRYAPPIKQEFAPPTTAIAPLSKPLTVMGLHNTPVIVEDPVRFRKDIQTMVMAQMMHGLPSDDELKTIKDEGSMIEIATVVHMLNAAEGNLDSFKYMMDRVLGKPVNQTNTVSMSVSYEQMLNELDPNEVITPKHVFCEEV